MYQYPDYMYHHGVKGMKWGVRRYQNADGSLTVAGKKREKYLNAKSKSSVYNPNIGYLKRDFKDQIAYEQLSSKKKSNHQLKLEEKYKAKGYNDRDAQIAAYNRVKNERRVAIVAGVAAVSVVAYASYKHYDKVTDKILGEGSEIGRVTITKDEPLDRAFYAYTNQHDKQRYVGLYGNTLNQQVKANMSDNVYNKTLKISKDLKVASPETSRKILSETLSDDQKTSLVKTFEREALRDRFAGASKRSAMYKTAAEDLKRGKVTDKVYDAFNVNLVSSKNSDMTKSFYSKLKESGYGAIRDVNDYKYSGYGSKNPLIIFDGSKVNVEKVSTLGENIINKQHKIETAKLLAKSSIKTGAMLSGAVGGMLAFTSSTNKIGQNSYIKNYYKAHPNTDKTRNDLIRDYEKRLSQMKV